MSELDRVLVVTYIPSPYQVELLNAVRGSGQLDLEVAYLFARDPDRDWSDLPITHPHRFLEDDPERYRQLMADMAQFDLVVFCYYQHPQVHEAIAQRAQTGRPWCFWGERPGYRQKIPGLGYWYRRWKFPELFAQNVPVWGIGQLAVERYRQELGGDRAYFNVPYFSELQRFGAVAPREAGSRPEGTRAFLFCGSFIQRKGVDLLAGAFARLARELPQVRLSLLGSGPLQAQLEESLAGLPVTFLGFQPWEKLPEFYQTADILCVPSRHDGWALVVPEGLASGLPIVATTTTGAAYDLVRAGENGWTISPNSETALYGAMKEAALLSPQALAARSQAARASVAEHQLADGVRRFCQAARKSLRTSAAACPQTK